jgi:hypothetical protein
MIQGIDGNTLVGSYSDSTNVYHGFEATIPEPSPLVLLGIGAISLLACTWQQRRRTA